MKLPVFVLVVGLLAGAPCAAGQRKNVKRSPAEVKAIAAIEKLGGFVRSDKKDSEKPCLLCLLQSDRR
jgi:hypothetical protein